MQADLETARLRYTDNHPEVKRLEGEIAGLEQLEQARRAATPRVAPTAAVERELRKDLVNPESGPKVPLNAVRPEVAQAILRERERLAGLKTQVKLVLRELEVRNAEQKAILGRLAEAQRRIENLPIREREMAALTRDYENSKTNYQSLLDKKLAAGMATEMERRQKAERFTVLDAARSPERPFKPNRQSLQLAACGLGFVLGVALAIGREVKKNVLLGEWELPADLYVLGRVGRIGSGAGSSRPTAAEARRADKRAAALSSSSP